MRLHGRKIFLDKESASYACVYIEREINKDCKLNIILLNPNNHILYE